MQKEKKVESVIRIHDQTITLDLHGEIYMNM